MSGPAMVLPAGHEDCSPGRNRPWRFARLDDRNRRWKTKAHAEL
jgi:hypothetical protein